MKDPGLGGAIDNAAKLLFQADFTLYANNHIVVTYVGV